MSVAYENKKYANAVLYFVKYCNNEFLGSTKLNKLLYYLDFISFRDRGKSVTGDDYLHLGYGPVPENIDSVITSLKEDGIIEVSEIEYKNGSKVLFGSKVDPDMNIFDSYENELLNKICEEFALWPTEKIVSQTHLEAPWFFSKLYEKVDYNYSKDIDFFTT